MRCTMTRVLATTSQDDYDIAFVATNTNSSPVTDAMAIAIEDAFIQFDQTDTVEGTDPISRILLDNAVSITITAGATAYLLSSALLLGLTSSTFL